MLKRYFTTAIRNIFNSKSYSAINILGLAAGLASFIIILLYLNYELNYDKWDPSLKRVYKVSLRLETDYMEATPAPLASLLLQKYPGAETATSLQTAGDYEILVSTGDKKIYQTGMVIVDSLFLETFPYTLVKGDRATALQQPNAVVLSEEVSYLLFGNENPMGKTIKAYNAFEGVVTGVMKKASGPSHLDAQLLMRDPYGKENMHWFNYSYQTYIKLKQPVAEAKMEDDINRIYYNERLKENNTTFEQYQKAGAKSALFTDAVPAIHNFPKHGSSNFKTVAILLLLAALLLLSGAINFSNMAIAKSMRRAKEVGIRKVLGSGRRELILQFMFETGLQCIISLCIAMLIVGIALPYFNSLFNISLGFWMQDNTLSLILQVCSCLLIVILVSGFYPALLLSHFKATRVLKGDYSSGKKGVLFRNGLIIVQFMVAAFFIAATFIISRQLNFMQMKDKGFSAAQVLRIQTTQKTRDKTFDEARNTLLAIAGVSDVAKTTEVPGDKYIDTSTYGFKYAGQSYRMASTKVSTGYFKTLDVGLVKGRFFNDGYADQNTRNAIINEAAAAKLGLTDPEGKVITFPGCDTLPIQIIGVVKNFNIQGFETAVQPTVYTIGNKACIFQSGGAILVKIQSDHIKQVTASIEQAWKTIEPDFPIRYSFLDDNFQKLFVSYQRLQTIIGFFATIAIIISVMGLFALTAFFAGRRTREIGIRKVLGANITGLVSLLGRDFIYLVLISVLIATPVAWWAMSRWLDLFAYRITISWGIFLLTGLVVTLVALLTVSFHAVKAAMANPVKSLRSE